MSLLAPPLNLLIDAAERHARGEAPAAEVRSCLPAAREFCSEGRGLFGLISPGLLRTPAVDRLLDECAQDLDAQEQALATLEQALDEGAAFRVGSAAGRLREAATRLALGYGGLHEEEQKEKIYSPFPALDHFLKVGLNVLEGHATRAHLADRFPPVVAVMQRLERDVERFAALYGHPEVAASVRELVGTLQAGLGALIDYFESDRRGALADALKLLGRGSAALQEGLVEMDRRAAAGRPGAHPYLAELRLALERGLPWPLVQDAWGLVTAAADHYRQELDAFRRFPLYPFLEAEEARAREALDSTAAALAGLDFARPGIRPDLGALEGAFDALSGRVMRLWERLEEEMARYREAPHLEELRERVGRALLGEPSEELLRERLAHFREVQRSLAAEAAGGGLPPTLAAELTALFAGQEEGYGLMLASLPQRDLATLRRGWELLEATLPRMLEVARGMREAIAARREAAPAGPTCLRCGQRNAPGTRYCTGCNAVLPALDVGSAEQTDVVGGEPGGGPTRLSRLEGLMAGADPSEILGEVAALQEMAAQIAGRLRQQAGSGAEADFAAFFQERVEAYRQGLGWIRACVEAGDGDGMWQGLEACRSAEEDIAELKREIDAAI